MIIFPKKLLVISERLISFAWDLSALNVTFTGTFIPPPFFSTIYDGTFVNIYGQQTYQNACIVGESKVFFIQFKNCVNSFLDDPAF